MTSPPDDTRSLESWLREKALEAHNEAERYPIFKAYSRLELIWMVIKDPVAFNFGAASYLHLVYKSKENAFNEVITKIQNGRVDQRPHVRDYD